jgi:hypothetical protein
MAERPREAARRTQRRCGGAARRQGAATQGPRWSSKATTRCGMVRCSMRRTSQQGCGTRLHVRDTRAPCSWHGHPTRTTSLLQEHDAGSKHGKALRRISKASKRGSRPRHSTVQKSEMGGCDLSHKPSNMWWACKSAASTMPSQVNGVPEKVEACSARRPAIADS